uniref:Sestrin-2-like n=1 Tax=Hirondellea gigas TaxID=1518452 RepID=A0A2P2I9M5_9CRUS
MFAGVASSSGTIMASHLGLASPDQVLEDILAGHQDYLHKFIELYSAVMEHEDALCAEERNYVALMAACRHKCSVLLSEQRARFTDSGGPPQWLEGLDHAPERIRSLHIANIVLAHRPWMFHRSHIEELVKAGLSFAELVHGLTILIYFHSMSSMLHALGIEAATGQADLDYHVPSQLGAGGSEGSPRSSELSTGGVAVLLQRMKGLTTNSNNSAAVPDHPYQHQSPLPPVTAPHNTVRNSNSDAAYATGLPGPVFDAVELDEASEDEKYMRFSLYSPNISFTYKDFYRRGGKSEAPTLKYQHQWEEIGFSMLAKFTSQDLADSIDIKFKTAFNMTYNTCGDRKNVSTTPFRRAIWYYTQSLYGIRRDDYDYSTINEVLDRPLKVFLKTMSVAPERLVTAHDSAPSIIDDLRTSEQVHIVILAAEARMQAEMVYAMLAVERYYM